MEITEVKVFPIQEEKLKAFVSVVFDHCFMVNDIKVIQGRDGLFISMPSRKKKNGEFKDVAHPLNNETRRRIEGQVLGKYEEMVGTKAAIRELPVDRLEPPAPPAAPESDDLVKVKTPPSVARGPWQDAEPKANGAGEAAPPEAAVQEPAQEENEGDTLEEVQEKHLSDSFWTV